MRLSTEEMAEGLFGFDQVEEPYHEVSVGSLERGTETNEKKASKRDIIAVDDKELSAGQEQWTNPKEHSKLNLLVFACGCATREILL